MFSRNFNKPGPGIDKNQVRKEGFALFWEIITREFWTLLAINLAFIVTCIPIVTIGPSVCALNYICAKIMRDEPLDGLSDYKRGFMINLKQGIPLGIIVGFIFFSLGYSFLFYKEAIGYFAYIILFLLLVFSIANVYIFLLCSSITLPIRAIFQNSFLLFGISPVPTLKAFGINFIIAFISLYYSNELSGFFYMLIGFSLTILINSFFAYPQIEKYITASDTADTEVEQIDEIKQIEQAD